MTPEQRGAYYWGARHALEGLQIKLVDLPTDGNTINAMSVYDTIEDGHAYLDALWTWLHDPNPDAPPPHPRLCKGQRT